MNVIKFNLFNYDNTEWLAEVNIDGINVLYTHLEVLIRNLIIDAKIDGNKVEIRNDEEIISFVVDEGKKYVIWNNLSHSNITGITNTLVFDKEQYYKEITKAKKTMYNLINGSDENVYKNKFFCMEHKNICYGWLDIAFGRNENVWAYAFDECLSDPFPRLVRMYHKIKMGEDYKFEKCEDGIIVVSVEMLKCDNDSVDELIFRAIYEEDMVEEKMSREYCLAMFEALFSDLLYDEDYPWQYPCHCCLNDREYDIACDKEIEAYELAKKEPDYDDHTSSYLLTKFIREMVTVNKECYGLYNKFTAMLRELKVPYGWK